MLMDRPTSSECQVSVCCKREGLRKTSSFTRKLSANLCSYHVFFAVPVCARDVGGHVAVVDCRCSKGCCEMTINKKCSK